MKTSVIHYIGQEFNPIFIVAKTSCGKHWQDVNETTSVIKYVTCKICLKKKEKAQELVDKMKSGLKYFASKEKAQELVDRFGKKLAITTVNNWIVSGKVELPIDYLEEVKSEIEKL